MALAENPGNRRNILPTQAKVDRVTELKEKLENSSIVIAAGFSGMGSNQMVDLRRRMRDGGVEFVVIKNNLLNLAADAADIPQLKDIITGQTGIALGYEDPATAAKTVNAAAVAGGILRINGAVVDRGIPMAASEVSRLAALPPRPVLVAQLLGNMQWPLYGLLSVLSGPLRSLAYLLQARSDQLQQTESAA
jgi:large subunit ribosomal protein L10